MDQTENSTANVASNADENLGLHLNTSYEFLDLFSDFTLPSDANDVKTSIESSDGVFVTSTSGVMATPGSPSSSVTDKIETLKKINFELQQKNQEQENNLAEYEDKLAEQMNKIMKIESEKTALMDMLKALENEKEELTIKYNEKMAELKQFKGLAKENDETKLLELQRTLIQETKQLKKAERDLQRSNVSLNEVQQKNSKIDFICRQLMNRLLEFGEKFKHSNLLSKEDKHFLKYVEESHKDDSINWKLDKLKVHVKKERTVSDDEQHNRDNSINMDTSSPDTDLVTIKVGNKSNYGIPDAVAEPRNNLLPFSALSSLNYDNSVNMDTSSPDTDLVATKVGNKSNYGIPDAVAETRNNFLPFSALSSLNHEAVTSTPISNSHSNKDLNNHGGMFSGVERMLNLKDSDNSIIVQEEQNKKKQSSNFRVIPNNTPCFETKGILSDLGQNGAETDSICSDTDLNNFTEEDFDQVKELINFDKNFMPLSPVTSPLHQKSVMSRNNKIAQECQNSHNQVNIHYDSTSINQNNIATPKKLSPKYLEKRNTLYHQTSRGFEPNVEESAIKSEKSFNRKFPTKPDISTYDASGTIPSDLHYISSMRMDNTTFFINEGSAICDVLINTATGQSISSVTKPTTDDLPLNLSDNNNDNSVLASFFHNLSTRRRNVLSLYHAASESSPHIKTEKRTSPKSNNNRNTIFSQSPGQSWRNDAPCVHSHIIDSELHASRTEVHPDVSTCLSDETVQNAQKITKKANMLPVKKEKPHQRSFLLQNDNYQQILQSSNNNPDGNEFCHSLNHFTDNQDRSVKKLNKLCYHLPSSPELQKSHEKETNLCSKIKNKPASDKYVELEPSVPKKSSLNANIVTKDRNIHTNGELPILENVEQNYSSPKEKFSNSGQAHSELKLQILSPPTSPNYVFENEPLSPDKIMDGFVDKTAINNSEKTNTKRNSIKRQRKVQINEANNITAAISPSKNQNSENFNNIDVYEEEDDDDTADNLNSLSKVSEPVSKKCKYLNDSAAIQFVTEESENFEVENQCISDVASTNKSVDFIETSSEIKNAFNGLGNLVNQNKVEKPGTSFSLDETMTSSSKETNILSPCKTSVKVHKYTGFENVNNTCVSNTNSINENTSSSEMAIKQKRPKLELNKKSQKSKNKVKILNQPFLEDKLNKSLANGVKHFSDLTDDCAELNEENLVASKCDISSMDITQEVDANFRDSQNIKITQTPSASFNKINVPLLKKNKPMLSVESSALKPLSENSELGDISKNNGSSDKLKINDNSKIHIKNKINGATSPRILSTSKDMILASLKRSPRIAEKQKSYINATFPVMSKNKTTSSVLNKKSVKNTKKKSKKKGKRRKRSKKLSNRNNSNYDTSNCVVKVNKANIACLDKQLQNGILGSSISKNVKNCSSSRSTENLNDVIQDTCGDNLPETQKMVLRSEHQDLVNDCKLKSSQHKYSTNESTKNFLTVDNNVSLKDSKVNSNTTSVADVEPFSNESSSITVNQSDSVNDRTPLNHFTTVSSGLFDSQSNMIKLSPLKDSYNGTPSTDKTEKTHPFEPRGSPNGIPENSNSDFTVQAEIHPCHLLDDKNSEESSVKNGFNVSSSNTNAKDLLNHSSKSDISDDENTLVIVENIEEEKCVSEKESLSETEKLSESSVSPKKGSLKKKRKNTTSKKKDIGNTAGVPSIAKALEDLEKLKFDESHTKLYIHTLINALINPTNAPDARHVVFEIIKHLSVSKRNPFYTFSSKDLSIQLPPSENCIVESLIKIQKKVKSHLQGLITCAIETLGNLVISKDNIDIYGLGAFCRVFTSFCRYTNNINRPVMLCSDLLKMQHKYAPFLIASIVIVWPDLFDVAENSSDLEMQFHGAIAYGVNKKPSTLHATQWKQCSLVLSKYLLAQPTSDVMDAATTIMDQLKFLLEEEPIENEFMLIDPLVIFSAYEGWDWAQKTLLDKFIVPSLKMYARKKNERAFTILSALYADTVLLSPHPKRYLGHMEQYFFKVNVPTKVKCAAALSLLKIILKINVPVPDYLMEWVHDNQDVLLANTSIYHLLAKRLMSDSPGVTLEDVISLTTV